MRALLLVCVLWSATAWPCSFFFPLPGDGIEAPFDGARNVPTNTEIVIVFSFESLDGTISLSSPDGELVPIEVEIGPIQTRIIPLRELETGTRYVLSTSEQGNLFEFTTGFFDDSAPPRGPTGGRDLLGLCAVADDG